MEQLKQLVWISSGGLVVGTLVRRGHDAMLGIGSIVESPLLDLDSMLLGATLVLFWLWTLLAMMAITDHRPWAEAKEHWVRCYPSGGKWWARILFILLRWFSTVTTYLWGYFIAAFIGFLALVSGDVRDARRLFVGWCVMLFGALVGWYGTKGVRKNTLELNAVKILNLPEQPGHMIMLALIFSFALGALQYKRISQSFGGGRPEKAIVVLKKGDTTSASLQARLDGKTVDLLFRRGSKLGIKMPDLSDGQILVIDEAQIESLYVGKKVQEIDFHKLK